MVRDVYFDLDGTLTDPFEGISKCIRYALDGLGEPVPDDSVLKSCIGPPLIESFEMLVGVERAALALALYRERFGDVGWRENLLYDGIESTLLAFAKKDFRLYVATSKPRVYAARIVEHFGLSDYFQEVFGSGLDGSLVAKTELLAHAIRVRGGKAGGVMIGDRHHDITGAKNNGLFAIGAGWGYGGREELENAGADRIARRPEDVPALLAGRSR